MTPVMLLDVDGVVNALSKKPPSHVWIGKEWKRGVVGDPLGLNMPFLWSVPVIEWLTGLHEQGRVEIRWHTTWQQGALQVGEVLGLPEFKVQDCPEFAHAVRNGPELAADLIRQGMPPWWKYPAAERVCAQEKRDLIWVDDDIDVMLSRRFRDALGMVHRVKLVCPSGATGIVPKHTKAVDDILNAWWKEPRGALSGS